MPVIPMTPMPVSPWTSMTWWWRPTSKCKRVTGRFLRPMFIVRLVTGKPLSEPLPVLLHRTSYNKEEVEHEGGYAAFFARHGYIAVLQDCRGCFAARAVTSTS